MLNLTIEEAKNKINFAHFDDLDPPIEFIIEYRSLVREKTGKFKKKFRKAVLEKNYEDLRHLVHDMLPNLKIINLPELIDFLNQFETMNLNDKISVELFLDKVDEYCDMIQEKMSEE